MGAAGFKKRLQMLIDREPSISSFAKRCGCTDGVLRRYLSGKSLPGLDILLNIAKASNVSVEWLASGDSPAPEMNSNPILDRINLNASSLDDTSLLDILKYTEDKKETAELRNALARLVKLDKVTIKQTGCITLNLVYILSLPPFAILALVGLKIVTGLTAIIIFKNIYVLYCFLITSLFFYWKAWYRILISKYVSIFTFNDIG